MCSSNSPRVEDNSKSFNGVVRIRDGDGYRQRAACICSRKGSEGAEILLVTAKRRKYWILPGGGIEEAETKEQAVLRELEEEAGVSGTIVAAIGEYKDEDRLHYTSLFMVKIVKVLDDWMDKTRQDGQCGRERRWMTISEALSRIKPCQAPMIEQNIEIINDLQRKTGDDADL